MKYRCRKDILAAILTAAEQKDCTMAKLLSGSLVSHDQIDNCLPILLEERLLIYNKLSVTYKLTQKGLNFLTNYRKMSKIISSQTEEKSVST